MILNTSAYSVPLVQAGITYNGTLGFWESSNSFSSIGNSTVIHDYAVFGKLAYTSSPGAYPTGYDPDLFYYGFSYVHYTPVTIGSASSYIVRFGLALTLANAMSRTPVIFSTGGTGNLQFKTYGKFIKLVTTVPECCDLTYFNEDQPLLQLYSPSASFDPEGLNVYTNSYNNALVQHSQIRNDKLKKSVSFTCGATRNSVPVDNSAPSGYSTIHTEGEITEVVSWLNQETVLYCHSESDYQLGYDFQSTVKLGYYRKQFYTSSGSVQIYPGHLSYSNGRRKLKGVHLLYYPFTEYFIEGQLLVFNFSVEFGDPAGFIPYTPGTDKIRYQLSITGQFHQYGDYEQHKTIDLTYELKEDLSLINISHLSGSKTLTLVPITYVRMGFAPNYYINIPSTVTVTFSDDDYSAEVLPATLTLVSPEKHLQADCRMAGSLNTLGSYSYPSGLVAIDGITPVAGDRVYITTSTNFYAQGVWVASSGSWTRPTDYNLKYSYFTILEGTKAGNRYYLADSIGYVYNQFGVFPNQHDYWTVNNYTNELPSSITLNKVAGYNNYEAEFTTAVNVKNYIRLKLNEQDYGAGLGGQSYFGFTFQQWVQDLYSGGIRYLPSSAQIYFFNTATGTGGSLFYSAPATVKLATEFSGLITIRLFKMAATNNGSSSASENSITVQYLLDWPLDHTPT